MVIASWVLLVLGASAAAYFGPKFAELASLGALVAGAGAWMLWGLGTGLGVGLGGTALLLALSWRRYR
jgi:hypothetical protein